jgi:uncharacterized LabA/DUF88 family protein
MEETKGNYAFIDSQNLNLGIQRLGWRLDFRRFRVYLREKYRVSKAYLFIGYLPGNQNLYRALQEYGYILIFKPVLERQGGMKGNIDAELVLHAMIEYANYDQAIIVTSDGDFACLVEYLYGKRKLAMVLSPTVTTCSILLRRAAREKIVYMDNLEQRLAYKKRGGTA